MKIKTAKSAGFCYGVNRAINKVDKALAEGKPVATLGSIIHNTDVVNDMQKRGARIISQVAELKPQEYVVIRSHGVGKNIYDEIRALGNPVIDATCPFVKRIHDIVAKETARESFILIAGDEQHPEVQGIIGHCEQNYFVFRDKFMLKDFFQNLARNFQKTLAIVSQTTYNSILWGECLKVLPKEDFNIVVYQTICSATEERQTAAAELASQSDCMIVIGGKHSSNTMKLYDVCSEYCKTYHIENADELNTLDLLNAKSIGITAGASTPAYIIKEVIFTMQENLSKVPETEEDIDFVQAMQEDSYSAKLRNGDRVKGIVMSINNSEVIVDLGAKQTGSVPASELTNDPTKKPDEVVTVGEELDLIVTKVSDQEGMAVLSKKRVDEQAGVDKVIKAKEEGTVLEAVVSTVVKGGVNVYYEGVRVFIPASQTGLPKDKDLETIKGDTVKFVILEAPERRKSAVGSIRAVARKERNAAKAKFWENAEVGKEYEGEVKSLTSYGAFVDLGGIDGMVHISELSWNRIKHPSQVVSVGDVLKVYIKELDPEKQRISLGYKRTEDNPWEKFKAEYAVNDVVTAKIVSITSFGAFAQILDGVDGLIHISQLADRHVENVRDVVSVGDEVQVKIIGIDLENQRPSISIRDLLQDQED
ncbi:MAG: bifunctional 4-hydroxy-3-methylbut-2-enyl diphosphate reductase/30S ribosomal protein S1 [Oscillospiraceae bacterium]|nr:bifunctional 4-hydroxy-3-methylbut-2-enyl diphosphate reductase/30S ribosomal protein S1 [Oscillospiraceae bacterium]